MGTVKEKVKVICPDCGATNNYPKDAAGKKVVCGRCRSVLPEPGTVLEPSLHQISALIQNSSLPLLVDFYSPNCAPCHMMHPIVANLAQRRAGEMIVLRIDVDQHPRISSSLGVQSVPTFVIFYKGNERGRTSGAMSEMDFSLWVASKI